MHTSTQRFRENDYEIVRKDGLVFLREMAAEVKNFMDFKMSAVMVSNLFKFVDNFSLFPCDNINSNVGILKLKNIRI